MVRRAYPGEPMDFGATYIIPKPFDPRVLQSVAPAVAQAAMDSGVARQHIDIGLYGNQLQERIGEISSL